jgi:Zn-dependent protease with chaperone function
MLTKALFENPIEQMQRGFEATKGFIKKTSNRVGTVVYGGLEPLTKDNYPKLYEESQKLMKQIYAKYPNETIPPIYIQIKGAVNSYQQENAFYRAKTGTEEGEKIILNESFVNRNPLSTIMGVLAHEAGHDLLNHNSSSHRNNQKISPAISRAAECKADAVAVRETSDDQATEFDKKLLAQRGHRKPSPTDTHPLSSDRIKMAYNPKVLTIPLDKLHFDDKCNIIPASLPVTPLSKPKGGQVAKTHQH